MKLNQEVPSEGRESARKSWGKGKRGSRGGKLDAALEVAAAAASGRANNERAGESVGFAREISCAFNINGLQLLQNVQDEAGRETERGRVCIEMSVECRKKLGAKLHLRYYIITVPIFNFYHSISKILRRIFIKHFARSYVEKNYDPFVQ